MLHVTSITDKIYYISASFKFGVCLPQEWHRQAETCSSSEGLHRCVCHIVWFSCVQMIFLLAKCTEWIIAKYRNTVFTGHCASRTLEGGASLCHTFELYYFK